MKLRCRFFFLLFLQKTDIMATKGSALGEGVILAGQIITLVVLVAVSAGVSFWVRYCYDQVDLGVDIPLKQPSVKDINTADIYILDRYVREEICPAHDYFVLSRELSAINGKAEGIEMAASLFYIQVPLLLGMMRALYRIGFTESSFLCGTIALVICVICFVGASFIYRRTLKLPSFGSNTADLLERFEKSSKHLVREYDVSDEVALNSYIIGERMRYLRSIEETMRNRKVVRKFIGVAATIMFLLFFGYPSE